MAILHPVVPITSSSVKTTANNARDFFILSPFVHYLGGLSLSRISDGSLLFVQKSSDASSIPSYNGNNAVLVNGTEGKPGDYFIYDTKGKELKKVDNKNVKQLTASIFNGYEPALAMAAKAYSDIAELKEAIDLYNKHLGQ